MGAIAIREDHPEEVSLKIGPEELIVCNIVKTWRGNKRNPHEENKMSKDNMEE